MHFDTLSVATSSLYSCDVHLMGESTFSRFQSHLCMSAALECGFLDPHPDELWKWEYFDTGVSKF